MIGKTQLRKNVSIVRSHCENVNWFLRKAGWQVTFLGRSAGEQPFTVNDQIEALEEAKKYARRMALDAPVVAGQVTQYCDKRIAELRKEP